jgi:hypothetical protein
VLALLRREEISYCLCYPERSAKDEYLKRYIARGNQEPFIEVFIGLWDRFIGGLEQDDYANKHIVLKAGQFLGDVIGREV